MRRALCIGFSFPLKKKRKKCRPYVHGWPPAAWRHCPSESWASRGDLAQHQCRLAPPEWALRRQAPLVLARTRRWFLATSEDDSVCVEGEGGPQPESELWVGAGPPRVPRATFRNGQKQRLSCFFSRVQFQYGFPLSGL